MSGFSDEAKLQGDGVEYRVSVSGVPDPEVTWYLSGKQLTSTDTISVDHVGSSHRLRMVNLQMLHSGTVSVEAKNDVGLVRQAAFLTVHGVSIVYIHPSYVTLSEPVTYVLMYKQAFYIFAY